MPKLNRKRIPKLPTQREVDAWVNDLFSPAILGKERDYYNRAADAFQTLTIYYVQLHWANTPEQFFQLIRAIRFDYVGIISMLKRFQRDAYGVNRFEAIADQMVKDGKFSKETKEEILSQVQQLGLRITAESPRKTRVPAAFSLWMCVFRPISFDARKLQGFPVEVLEVFCAMVNYFMATAYLSKFGTTELGGTKRDESVRLERIRHDFTCREVSFSTMETFYSAIFRLDPRYLEHENTD